MIEYPADEARAIKADVGVAGTVHIGVADILLGLNHQRKEVRIGLQKLFRNGVTDQLVFRLDPANLHVGLASRGNHGNGFIRLFLDIQKILRIFQNHILAVPPIHIESGCEVDFAFSCLCMGAQNGKKHRHQDKRQDGGDDLL